MTGHPDRSSVETINKVFPELLKISEDLLFSPLKEIKDASNLAQVAHFDMLTYDQFTRNTRNRIDDNISNEKKIEALNKFSTHWYQPQMRILPFQERRRHPIDQGNPQEFVRGMRARYT